MTRRLFIGLISGTSRDGLDAVLADFSGAAPRILAARCTPYPPALRQAIDALIATARRPDPDDIASLDRELGAFMARCCLALLRGAGVGAAEVTAIGSHGQTVWHDPEGEPPVSLQLGDPETLAHTTGIVTVADFRSADLAAGGQGAPLAPLLHRELFADGQRPIAVVNLGGIANITRLQAAAVSGWDTGPANCLLDLWYLRHQAGEFDRDGAWASGGRLLPDLLEAMLSDPYFSRRPPKSTGLEHFNAAWLEAQPGVADRPPRDVQRTLVELTAATVARGVGLAGGVERVLACGGGVHNGFLMSRLRARLPGLVVESTAAHGVDPDWVEALLFAWLAGERLAGRALDTRGITGAREPVHLGRVSHPGDPS